jgi:acetate kinase
MDETILVLNAGSSSIKFQLFAVDGHGGLEHQLKGQFDGIGVRPRLFAQSAQGESLVDQSSRVRAENGVAHALEEVVAFLRGQLDGRLPIAMGHRVVHGGPDFDGPALVDRATLERLEKLVPLAPLHQPNNLLPIFLSLQRLPDVPQVACFDTAFHRGHGVLADHYAVPQQLYRDGVRRYGFHGLSYEYIAGRLHAIAPDISTGRVVVGHLGSGASLCAINNGRSVESTMGFTALDGLPMGTRSGQIDPGVVLYLIQQAGMSPREVEHLLYYECGLKGLSGLSNDVRVLLSSDTPQAKFALDYFAYRIALLTASMAAAMEGLDGLVFTAGIGENAPSVREAVANRLKWLGLDLDAESNLRGGPKISAHASRVACYVIPTDEEEMIARHTVNALRSIGR